MNTNNETQPMAVAATPKQVGEAQGRWLWVERSVWTERMLSRLDSNEPVNQVWFSLVDKTYATANLRSAWNKVQRNGGSAGVDRWTVKQMERQLEPELARLQDQLRGGQYRPQPTLRRYIDKSGTTEKRPLGIPAVRDRIVQGALRHVMEPIFEKEFAEHSYGFRPGRSAKQALRRVDTLLKEGNAWVVDADLKSYFDTIPQDRLLARIKRHVADGRMLALLQAFLEAGVMEEGKGWAPSECGTPQGGVISPLLANIYLSPLDHLMAQAGYEMVRYADDFVVLCRSEAEARRALELISTWVRQAGLILHPEKTRIVDATPKGGFDFLGYHFERGMKWPRKKSMQKLKERLRERIPRNSGQATGVIIEQVNRTLRGWFNYFQHSKSNVFGTVDGFVRRRLRSLMERRHGRRNGGYGEAHHRYRNVWFTERGLICLENEHAFLKTIVALRTH